MKTKRCFSFQTLCFIFLGFMLQGKTVAGDVNAVYKFKDSTKPFALYIEPYTDSPQQAETQKIKPEEPREIPMEIGRPEASTPPPAPAPKTESPEGARVESYQRKPQTRPTISDPYVFEEPSKPTPSGPVSSFFNFENLGFIQPAFAKNQVEQIVQGKPNPLPHKIFWRQGVRQRSFLVKILPSNGLCEENFNPIEIRELNGNQPAKQRCVQQEQPVLIEVSKGEGLTVLNGKVAPIWKEEGMKLQTQDKKYLENKKQEELKALEEKYAKERENLEQRYKSEQLNLEARYSKLLRAPSS